MIHSRRSSDLITAEYHAWVTGDRSTYTVEIPVRPSNLRTDTPARTEARGLEVCGGEGYYGTCPICGQTLLYVKGCHAMRDRTQVSETYWADK